MLKISVLGLLVGWATAYGVYRARHDIRAARGIGQQRRGDRAELGDPQRRQPLHQRFDRAVRDDAPRREVRQAERHRDRAALHPHAGIRRARRKTRWFSSVYRVVPNIPDHPYLQAPFNIETLSINELATGATALALLGVPGSGRTTALLAIALHSLGRVRFNPPMDKVQERLDAEEAKLEEKERAVRVKERVDDAAARARAAGQRDGHGLRARTPTTNRRKPCRSSTA